MRPSPPRVLDRMTRIKSNIRPLLDIVKHPLAVHADTRPQYIQANQPPQEDSACDSKGATRLWYSSGGRP